MTFRNPIRRFTRRFHFASMEAIKEDAVQDATPAKRLFLKAVKHHTRQKVSWKSAIEIAKESRDAEAAAAAADGPAVEESKAKKRFSLASFIAIARTTGKKRVDSSLMKRWEETCKLQMKKVEDIEEDTVEDVDDVVELEKSCRAAFVRSKSERSHTDLRALQAWLRMTKAYSLKELDDLEPLELDLLCKKIQLFSYHPSEIVFNHGDDGDALFIVFSGVIEVRTPREENLADVVVSELGPGDFFGARALTSEEPRKATAIARNEAELVKISHEEYTAALKQNHTGFLYRSRRIGAVRSQRAINNIRCREALRKKLCHRTQRELADLVPFLQCLTFFEGKPLTFVREIATVIQLTIMSPSTIVFREGETGDLFYIILTGSVDVKVNLKDARGKMHNTKIATLKEGTQFGELALMKGQGKRSASIITAESCEFLTVCEQDYNMILKKLQKEELNDKIQVLIRIPLFQTPEWTRQALEEVAYVLTPRKVTLGTVVYEQGEKSTELYIVRRGEAIITQNVEEPVTKKTYTVFVKRVGPNTIIGADAAQAENFNEVINRPETLVATTPLDMLVLTKYDVFHRLSKVSRAVLNENASAKTTGIVNLDQIYKTRKWQDYKKNLVKSQLNLKRVERFCVPTTVPTRAVVEKPKKVVKVQEENVDIRVILERFSGLSKEKEQLDEFENKLKQIEQTDIGSAISQKHSELLDPNSFLLIPKYDNTKVKKSTPNERASEKIDSLSKYTLHCNPEGLTVHAKARNAALSQALGCEATDKRRVLDEGNPVAYLNHIPSTRKGATDGSSKSRRPTSWMIENFVYSPRRPTEQMNRNLRSNPSRRQKSSKNLSIRSRGSTLLSEFERSDSFCAILNVANRDLRPLSQKPGFRIVGLFDAPIYANEFSEQILQDTDPSDMIDHLLVPVQKHVFLPADLKSHFNPPSGQQRTVLDHISSYYPPAPQGPGLVHTAEVTLLNAEASKTFHTQSETLPLSEIQHDVIPVEYRNPDHAFGCITVIPEPTGSARNGIGIAIEPIICIHGCFKTESDAMDCGIKVIERVLKIHQVNLDDHKHIYVCVVPMCEWVFIEDAIDWRISSNMHASLQSVRRQSQIVTAVSSSKQRAHQRRRSSLRGMPTNATVSPWERGRRLNVAICHKLGVKSGEDQSGNDQGYTIKSAITLDHKLKSLEEMLTSQSKATPSPGTTKLYSRKKR